MYYLKDEPKAIQELCGDQIPKEIMDEALRIGGQEGVHYLMQQGYGYFRVGDKVMNPEELGNYSLGVLATAKGYTRSEGYFVANTDQGFMTLKKWGENIFKNKNWEWPDTNPGELYDKYYQTMGMNDLALRDHRSPMPNMNSHKL